MNLRIDYHSVRDGILYGKTELGEIIGIRCEPSQLLLLNEIAPALHSNSLLQLLNVRRLDEQVFVCEFVIYEPDYLLDISALAECFKPYGNHPHNYVLSRLRIAENTRYILLGNAANYFIDELVNENEEAPVIYSDTIKRLFKTSPFEFAACDALQEEGQERAFFSSCKAQFDHIARMVRHYFQEEGIDKEKIILEPSFISNLLGLQGRLDLMLQDFSAFLELKSGKGQEDFRSGTFVRSSQNHYIQMILYLAVLEFNLQLRHTEVRSYLLYSKYPVLSKEQHSREHLQSVLHLRNRIVACEYLIQQHNSITYTDRVLATIHSGGLNLKSLSGNFFDRYLAPQIDALPSMLRELDEVERCYFMRLYAFVVKEMWYAKVGECESEGMKRRINLWNASEEEKKAAGEFMYDLKIVANKAAEDEHSIRLSIPEYEANYLPNFRQGDAVVLYEWKEGRGVGERQVFKGSIESLSKEAITIRLRARQRNTASLPAESTYAVEHDYMDVTFTGMFKGITAFALANPERRRLLLGRRKPEVLKIEPEDGVDTSENRITVITGKALAAKDCFLLVGPPGTGKTSQALRQMVKELSAQGKAILLLAYTNRAVDEICAALTEIEGGIQFIRIGNELNCDPKYRPYLLDNLLNPLNRRSEVQQLIERNSVFVSTVASAWNKPDLFRLKHFDVAIVDEATQLLEPHLLGILSVKGDSEQNAIDRFILIGDHKQLPAVILQSPQESEVKEPELRLIGMNNLNESLFERLYRTFRTNNWLDSFDMLCLQGRMHPEIAEFPSRYFYEGRLESLGLAHQQEDAPLLSPIPNRLCFLPSHRSVKDTSDKINHREAGLIVEYLTDLLAYYREKCLLPLCQSIGIITPYRSQIALIKRMIQESELQVFSDITIDTVERFQGGQKDIILYSFCLNANWQLESLPNCLEENGVLIDRKLNVALTRARKQLILIGNRDLLLKNPLYASLVRFVEDRKDLFV